MLFPYTSNALKRSNFQRILLQGERKRGREREKGPKKTEMKTRKGVREKEGKRARERERQTRERVEKYR